MVPYGDKNGWFLGKGFFISIHTSVWEVTATKFGKAAQDIGDFNPHLRIGGDLMILTFLKMDLKFQSTPPYRR